MHRHTWVCPILSQQPLVCLDGLEGTPQDGSLCYFQILGMHPALETEKKAKHWDNSVCHPWQVYPSGSSMLGTGRPSWFAPSETLAIPDKHAQVGRHHSGWGIPRGSFVFPSMPFITLALSSLETCVSQTVEEASPECESPGRSGHDLSRAHSVGGEGGDDKPASRAN